MCSSKKNHNSHGGHFRFRSPPPWNFHFRGACHTPPPPAPGISVIFQVGYPLKRIFPSKMPLRYTFMRKIIVFAIKREKDLFILKNQYSVTANVPNFDFLTGCWESRCKESKRTLRNPFASRLAEFDTTLKLQINDILFPLSFDLSYIGIFWRYFHFRWPEDQDRGSALMPVEGLFLSPSFHKSSDNRERNTQKWNGKNKDYVRKKPLRHGCDWGDVVELRFVKQNVFLMTC